jgi:hypothetical protein
MQFSKLHDDCKARKGNLYRQRTRPLDIMKSLQHLQDTPDTFIWAVLANLYTYRYALQGLE